MGYVITYRNNYRLLVALQNCFPQKWPILLLKATHGMQFKEIQFEAHTDSCRLEWARI